MCPDLKQAGDFIFGKARRKACLLGMELIVGTGAAWFFAFFIRGF